MGMQMYFLKVVEENRASRTFSASEIRIQRIFQPQGTQQQEPVVELLYSASLQ